MDLKIFKQLLLLTLTTSLSLSALAGDDQSTVKIEEIDLTDYLKDKTEVTIPELIREMLKKRLVLKGLYNEVNANHYVESLSEEDVAALSKFFSRDSRVTFNGEVLSEEGIELSKTVVSWSKLKDEVERATGTVAWGRLQEDIERATGTVAWGRLQEEIERSTGTVAWGRLRNDLERATGTVAWGRAVENDEDNLNGTPVYIPIKKK